MFLRVIVAAEPTDARQSLVSQLFRFQAKKGGRNKIKTSLIELANKQTNERTNCNSLSPPTWSLSLRLFDRKQTLQPNLAVALKWSRPQPQPQPLPHNKVARRRHRSSRESGVIGSRDTLCYEATGCPWADDVDARQQWLGGASDSKITCRRTATVAVADDNSIPLAR